ncbi:hypothetical protein Val02_26370 [Virgisporangium aliadipatigenens]|uniref:Uncharacterized protein n=1 Tax=Virgisporangium aliadipatigenens TaxID=741659 RepID=A0A8J3YIL3_9ACTN|nr:hypothetical protein Val02_26370 [Virgisporangium aliadipatigenens]
MSLREHHHVVGSGDGVHAHDPRDIPDGRGHVTRLSDFRLDEDVRLNHDTLSNPPADARLARETTARRRSGKARYAA